LGLLFLENDDNMTSTPTNSTFKSTITDVKRWLQANRKASLASVTLLVITMLIVLSSSDGSANSRSKETKNDALVNGEIIPVVIAPVIKETLNLYLFGLGVVTPLNTVEVSSRVSGQLMKIAFEDGQIVKEGDLLAQIDPQPFEVELTNAKGQLVRDQALLEQAQVYLVRYQKLLEQDSMSVELVGEKESLVRQYKAAVQAGQARVANAKLQLKYTTIKAPISGRVGFRKVSPGNIISASSASPIVSITQLDPISVIFPVPEDNLPKIMKLLNADTAVPIDIFNRSKKDIIGSGRLIATDNKIDATTGSIKLKAQLPNSDGSLFANQFVNVRMAVETRPNTILLPTAAIQRGVNGTFVYVVNEDPVSKNQTVTVTPIKLGHSEGMFTSIDNGVSLGQIVVVEGADRLRNNTHVKIITPDEPDKTDFDKNEAAKNHSDKNSPNKNLSTTSDASDH